jgi:hypothetical protein
MDVPWSPLDRLVISSSMPGVTANATYSKELKVVEASSKLTQLGGAAGAIAALMLLAALYAVRSRMPSAFRYADRSHN